MRIFILLLLLASLILPVAGVAATIEMDVNGLVCAFCAQGIEKTLRKFPATTDVLVSLENRLVALSTKDGQDIPDEELKHALTNAGYTVKAIRRETETLDDVRQRMKAQR